MIFSPLLLALLAPVLAPQTRSSSGIRPQEARQPHPAGFAAPRELPGTRMFSGRLIARPLQTRTLLDRGTTPTEARRTRARARRALDRYRLLRYVPQTDESIFALPSDMADLEGIRHLLDTGLFEYVEPDWLLSVPKPVESFGIGSPRTKGTSGAGPRSVLWRAPDDPLLGLQWHHGRMRSREAWFAHTGLPSISIGVCDTGVLTTHEDLQLHRLEGYNAVDHLWESQGGLISPVYPHGTRTTGVLAATGDNGVGIAGVGWNLSHRMLRVSNMSNGNAFLSDLQHGARTAIESGDRIASVSYAGVWNTSNATTGEYIRTLGGILVWAAGNSSFNYSSPDRDTDELIVVGATDRNDNLASFSNYGGYVDLVAPGVDIHTADSLSPGAYRAASGTSYACPITAGVCAMIWSQRPNLSPGDVQYILKHSTKDLGAPGVDDTFGYGRVDLKRALALTGTRTPQADLSAIPSSGRSPLTVVFHDLSTGVPTSWFWDFGDGTTSTAQSPVHTYVNSGRYTVSLNVDNSVGSSSVASIDYVQVDVIPPVADFSATPTGGLTPMTVSFTDTSTGGAPTSWAWDFGDGAVSALQNPSHRYTVSGLYTVTLTATNAYGSSAITYTDLIAVDFIPPIASFSAQPTSGASPIVVQFTDTSTGGVATAWSWSFGDGGTSTARHPSHTYTTAGTYTVRLTATNAYGSDTLTLPGSVSVGPGPTIVANFTGTPTVGTAPLTVSFTDLSIGSVLSWAWDFGDGGLSSAQNPTYTFTTPGLYNVALQVTDPTGQDSQLELMDYIDVR